MITNIWLWICLKSSFAIFQHVFVCKWRMENIHFEIGPVLSESDAAGSHRTGCNVILWGNCTLLKYFQLKCLFLPLACSDWEDRGIKRPPYWAETGPTLYYMDILPLWAYVYRTHRNTTRLLSFEALQQLLRPPKAVATPPRHPTLSSSTLQFVGPLHPYTSINKYIEFKDLIHYIPIFSHDIEILL